MILARRLRPNQADTQCRHDRQQRQDDRCCQCGAASPTEPVASAKTVLARTTERTIVTKREPPPTRLFPFSERQQWNLPWLRLVLTDADAAERVLDLLGGGV